jgi:hypothetical protein
MLSSPSLEPDLQVTSAESLVRPHHTIDSEGQGLLSKPKASRPHLIRILANELRPTSQNPGVPVASGGIARLWKMGTATELH